MTEKKQPGACIQCHASNLALYRFAGKGDVQKGFEQVSAMPYDAAREHEGRQGPAARPALGRLRRLPRPGDDGGAGDAARLPGGDQGAQGEAGDRRLRPEPRRQPAGDARLRLRPVPRGVLLQGRGEGRHLPVGERDHGRRDRGLLRQGRLHGLGARGDGHQGAQGPASRVRGVEPGHPRAGRGRLRGLPHALRAGGGDEGQRPLGAEPAAEPEPGVPDVSPRGGAGARRRAC